MFYQKKLTIALSLFITFLIWSNQTFAQKELCRLLFPKSASSDLKQLQIHQKTDYASSFQLVPKKELLDQFSISNSDSNSWSVLVRLVRQWIIEEGYFQTQALVRSDQFYYEDLWKNKKESDIFTQLKASSYPLKRTQHETPEFWGIELTQGDLGKDHFELQLNLIISKPTPTSDLYVFIQSKSKTTEDFQGPTPKLKILNSIHKSLYTNIKKLYDLNDGTGSMVHKESAQTITFENVHLFAEKIHSPYRVYPIVLLSNPKSSRGRSLSRPLLDETRLAQFLFGMAEVYVLPTNENLYESLKNKLGPYASLLVQNGDARVISKETSDHGYWTTSTLQTENPDLIFVQIRSALMQRSVTRTLLNSRQFQLISLKEIELKNKMDLQQRQLHQGQVEAQEIQNQISVLESLVKKTISNHKLLTQVEDLYRSILLKLNNIDHSWQKIWNEIEPQKEHLQLEKEITSLRAQLEILQEDLFTLKPFITEQEQPDLLKKDQVNRSSPLDLENPPHEFHQMLKSVVDAYKDRIIFADEAYHGAKDLKNFLKIKENRILLYKVLAEVPTTLWNLYSNNSKNIENNFKSQMLEKHILHVSMARGESHQTLENNRLARQRFGTHGGRVYKGYAHIRYNNGSNNIFRIHFVYESHLGKIVVTRITDHLEVFSRTR